MTAPAPESPRPSVGALLPRDLPAADVLEFARRAERLGFDELWVVEDLGFRGGFAQAAAVLATTSRIHVGVGILPAAARNVAYAAMEVATLAQLFPGRVTIGIGHGMPGWMRSVGAWPDRPLAFLRAYARGLAVLLAGMRLDDDELGLAGVRLEPSSLPDVVPDILLGVRGPRSLAVAGRFAQGTVLAEPTSPEYVRAALEQIAAPGPHRLVGYDVAAVRDDEATALAAVRPALEWIGEPDWAPHLAPLPFADELAALRARSATRADFTRDLPDAWVRRLALVGTPAQVREQLAERRAAGLTASVLLPTAADPLAGLDDLARVL
jgi:5,10-methylenetetrahydromethanopterin reductase